VVTVRTMCRCPAARVGADQTPAPSRPQTATRWPLSGLTFTTELDIKFR
jgi:hypothetical protein